jgi:hypothetical protein
MKPALRFAVITLLAVAGSSAVRAQSNPLVGTWKLNLTKSKYDPGPTPKSLTRTVEAQGNGVKYTFEGVAADGTPIAYGFSATFDGEDNPVTGSMPPAQTRFRPSASTPTITWRHRKRAARKLASPKWQYQKMEKSPQWT